ncbi:hypothetical protein KKH82_02985 [Patescibacteria group bacterium]|nr:hypothetical protein [Patescibacteria group bacterium]
MNAFKLWEKNWDNAYAFFNRRVETETKSKLKDRWYKEFNQAIQSAKKEELEIIKERFDYWEDSRGAYILSPDYRNELREFIFTGKAKGLCDFEQYKKQLGIKEAD